MDWLLKSCNLGFERPWPMLKDLEMTILKWPNQLAQPYPNNVPLVMWYCSIGNIGNFVPLTSVKRKIVICSKFLQWKYVVCNCKIVENDIF
jgi:hypothetical protein